jgi:hypothetical protein
MFRKIFIIVFVLSGVSCRTEVDTRDTKLDKLVESADDSLVENPTIRSTEIVNDQSKRSALIAFRNSIEFMACCVPDKEIAKLKNFESIKAFKNGSSKILYADNLVITTASGDRREDNIEFNNLIDSYFDKIDFKKLEIGTGGPAIWTHE